MASVVAAFKAVSRIKPAVTSIASFGLLASPSAAKPFVACRAVFASEVSTKVKTVLLVTTALAMSDSENDTLDKELSVSPKSISQDNLL